MADYDVGVAFPSELWRHRCIFVTLLTREFLFLKIARVTNSKFLSR